MPYLYPFFSCLQKVCSVPFCFFFSCPVLSQSKLQLKKFIYGHDLIIFQLFALWKKFSLKLEMYFNKEQQIKCCKWFLQFLLAQLQYGPTYREIRPSTTILTTNGVLVHIKATQVRHFLWGNLWTWMVATIKAAWFLLAIHSQLLKRSLNWKGLQIIMFKILCLLALLGIGAQAGDMKMVKKWAKKIAQHHFMTSCV